MKKRSRKYTAKRGGFFKKDKYKGFTPEEKEKVIKLKAFLKAILTDKDDVESYMEENKIEVKTGYVKFKNIGQEDDLDNPIFETLSFYKNTFFEKLKEFFPSIIGSGDTDQIEKFLHEILSNCTDNCKDYITALQKIYERVDKPEWMKKDCTKNEKDSTTYNYHKAFMQPNLDLCDNSFRTEAELSIFKQKLTALFCKVEAKATLDQYGMLANPLISEDICNPNRINYEIPFEENDSDYYIATQGGKRKKTLRRRRSLKKKKTRRRLKKNKK
jgi:hypothetical protein